MSRQHPGETYRATIAARCPSESGGGACTLILRRVNGRIELLFHGVLSTGAVLTDDDADALTGHVTAARRERQP